MKFYRKIAIRDWSRLMSLAVDAKPVSDEKYISKGRGAAVFLDFLLCVFFGVLY